MLFNSYTFVFAFLPLVLGGFYLLTRSGRPGSAKVWLIAASLIFYARWNPPYVVLLTGSVAVNYAAAQLLGRWGEGRSWLPDRRWVLAGALLFNLGLLGYFKYANFFVSSLGDVLGSSWTLAHVILPLGISFFTFQQVAYMVDAYRGRTADHRFVDYALFVTFFPQLIAGPIVHHREVLPQFGTAFTRVRAENLAVGLTIFAGGLFKKVIIADSIATYASPVFAAAAGGAEPAMVEAWGAALAFTLQLYFDFSGYSDMAIGLGRMFGIRLPLNFNSPYQAWNITEFWGRWHITLTRFLREYVYFPLGGSRRGPVRRAFNTMVTMLASGLWHGAGWTFVAWGGLHGVLLVAHQTWRGWRGSPPDEGRARAPWSWARLLTFFVVVVGWVLFRAESFAAAGAIFRGMAGLNGISLPTRLAGRLPFADALPVTFDGVGAFGSAFGLLLVAGLVVFVWVVPDLLQLVRRARPVSDSTLDLLPETRWSWRWSFRWAAATGVVSGAAVLGLTRVTEFLYFQF